MNLNRHPRSLEQRGIGELMPGFWDIPDAASGMVGNDVTVVPRIGEIMAGRYVVPQNPVADFSRGSVKMLGTSGGPAGCGSGMGCACAGSINGMGDVSSDFSAGNYSAVLTDTLFTIGTFAVPTWIALAAGIAVFALGKKR